VFGRWDRPDGTWIGFFPQSLDIILREGGYQDMDGPTASWRDRGWLIVEHEGGSVRTRIRKRVGGDPNARVIAVRRSAIEQVDPPGPETAEPLNQAVFDGDEPEGEGDE
jgi:hypothetical protein